MIVLAVAASGQTAAFERLSEGPLIYGETSSLTRLGLWAIGGALADRGNLKRGEGVAQEALAALQPRLAEMHDEPGEALACTNGPSP